MANGELFPEGNSHWTIEHVKNVTTASATKELTIGHNGQCHSAFLPPGQGLNSTKRHVTADAKTAQDVSGLETGLQRGLWIVT